MPRMSFEVDIGYTSQRGLRAVNEDFGGAVCASEHEASRGLIAVLADGVSGCGYGLEAAQTTVMGLLADFFATPPTWQAAVALERLIRAQNAWLADHNRRRGGQGAALTTLTALALQGQTWTLAHVGDCRAWLLRLGPQGTELHQLSRDHALTDPDLRGHLTRAVGWGDGLRIDFSQGEACLGDCFVLSSDGVHGVLKASRLAELARTGSAQQAADALVQAALAAGSRDNASALVIRLTGLDARPLHAELLHAQRLPIPPLLQVGEVLDGYTLTACVADTGHHLLYQARSGAGALVVLKTLHPSHADDAEACAALAHEAWLGQRMTSSGERGFAKTQPRPAQASAFYVVFDWHAGHTLAQRMARQPSGPAVAEVVAAALEWARALGVLHRQGVVHRSIQPSHLHWGEDGQWRLFGLSAALSGRESQAQRALPAGAPGYTNPEQCAGASADARSDLFALGVTLYQWLTGQLPYGETTLRPSAPSWRYLGGWLGGRLDPSRRRAPICATRLRPDVPMWLARLLAKAVAPDARQRFASAEELLLALERGASRAPLPMPTRLRRHWGAVWRLLGRAE